MYTIAKRSISFVLCLLLLVSSIPRVDASVVNYNVYAFHGGANSNYPLRTHELPLGSTWVYGENQIVFGYYVEIPPSQLGGYLVVAGYFPVSAGGTGTGWYQPVSAPITNQYAMNALLSSTPSPGQDQASQTGSTTPNFDGIIYIPPHDRTLYLMVTASNRLSSNGGARALDSAFVSFIPDSTSSQDQLTVLQEISNSIQNIYNEIQASPDQIENAQQMLDDLQDTMDEIQDMIDIIEEKTNRPPPESVVPSMSPDLTNPTEPAAVAGRDAISFLLSTPLLVEILLMVFMLAFVRYVLFGKSQ